MNKVQEIEKLRMIVMIKHFYGYYCSGQRLQGYNDLEKENYIDKKVLYYIQLGITAEELEKSIIKK